ncbi:MAG TPA: protein-disulfide reductase DsbD domain-containing protein [Candidatus Binatia bacterium]|nr:protein-disulfide reductase DsbD domain-containing protein [Candidatus Binatia bacterium]
MRLTRWFMLAFAALSISGGVSAANKTDIRLLLAADSAAPGETVMAGVHLHMSRGWHTYWRNGGEAGDPTKIQWELPPGIAAGPILWPVPEKETYEGLTTYIYNDEVVLLVPLTLGKGLAEGPIQIKAKISWLECTNSGLCVAAKEDVNARLTIAKVSKPSANARLIEQFKARLPVDGSFLQPTARWDGQSKSDERSVLIEWSITNAWNKPDFLPYESKEYEITPGTEVISLAKNKVALRKTVKKIEGDWPGALQGLLVNSGAGYEVQIPIAAAKAAPLSAAGFLGMLAAAFLGGLILNFMPCVLPVIALKILSFVNQSKEHPARVRALGIVYALGVIASFLVLAGLAIAVQQAGGLATWGMALQNQVVRVLLTVVITLVALNLFGLFEVTVGGAVIDAAGQAAGQQGYAGAFFNGILATILATPCTAPFLTGALAFGFTQPPLVTALAFVAAGLGLAFPYILLSWKPALLKVLPRPGAWTEKFKIAMGFPMLATAVWLYWISASSYGDNGVLWLGFFLVVLAAAAWTFGAFYQRSFRRRGVGLTVVLALLATGYFGILEGQLSWRARAGRTADAIDWQPWSPEAVAEARTAGRPVLVDFTAKTCSNCLVNKRTSIEIPSTRAKLKQINGVALLGDFTDIDPRIAAELRKFGRAGVPLVLVYPKDPAAPPIVLPPILTPGIVHEALDKAAGTNLDLSAR